MVPKIVHYCWFGGNEMPQMTKRNISDWKKVNPDFKFVKWDESNFNLQNANDFVKEAYKNKKWAFVSDYVRLFAVYNYGGFYFDTDVHLIKPLNNVLHLFPNGFIGFQNETFIASGLGFSAENESPIIQLMLKEYDNCQFDTTKSIENVSCPILNTEALVKLGLQRNNSLQKIGDITVLPNEYLSPLMLSDGKKKITSNTISIHEYNASWMKPGKRMRIHLIMLVKRILPPKAISFIKGRLRRN